MSTSARRPNGAAYRTGLALAFVASALLAWLAAGVGVIGADGDPANAMYAGVLAVGLVGAAMARLRPRGMRRTALAMATVQALVAAVALAAGLGRPYSRPLELVVLNAFFVALFAGSALLFREASRR